MPSLVEVLNALGRILASALPAVIAATGGPIVPADSGRLTVLLAEMKQLGDEVRERLKAQDGLLNYIFIIIAAALAAGVPLAKDQEWRIVKAVALTLPILASSIAFVYISHEVMIYSAACYVTTRVRPKLKALVGDDVCDWDQFLWYEKRHPIRRLLSVLRPLVLFLPFAISMTVFFAVRHGPLDLWERALVALDVVLTALVAVGVIHGAVSLGGLGAAEAPGDQT